MNLIYWQSLRTTFVCVCVCSCVDEADNDLYWSVVAACGSDSFSHKTNITHAMQTPAHTNTRSSQTNMALGPWITDINLDGGRFRAVLQIYSFNHLWDRFYQHVRCCDIFLPKINKYFFMKLKSRWHQLKVHTSEHFFFLHFFKLCNHNQISDSI